MVDAAFDWRRRGKLDRGSEYWKQDAGNNAGNAALTAVDSTNNIVYTNQKTHVALLGVKNLIVVQTGDSILVADLHEAEKIKNLITKIPLELQ